MSKLETSIDHGAWPLMVTTLHALTHKYINTHALHCPFSVHYCILSMSTHPWVSIGSQSIGMCVTTPVLYTRVATCRVMALTLAERNQVSTISYSSYPRIYTLSMVRKLELAIPRQAACSCQQFDDLWNRFHTLMLGAAGTRVSQQL